MPVTTLSIDNDQVESILGLHESHFIDMKSIEIKPAKLTKALSAFANSDGGELYIGVGETSRGFIWSGFQDEEAANGHIQAFETLFPLGDGLKYEFLSSDSQPGLVLHVIILRSAAIRKASDGTIYVRRGASSSPVNTPEALRKLELDKGITSFETERVNIPPTEISNSLTTIQFMLTAFPAVEPESWMHSQRVIVDNSPTVAGVLLFADLPQPILPKRSSVKLYRYRTTETEGGREYLVDQPATIEGPLYQQINESVEKTTKMVESIKKVDDSGLTAVSYPPETLHEIITNAVLHRDYSIADDIHIRVFDNRVEVESPGRLAGHVSPENILDERFARNGSIVRLINKFPDPPNKDIGEGLNTAFAAMKQLKLKEPIIEEHEHSVVVLIRHEKLASPEQIVMEYLENHEEITNRIVRELTGIGSENRVKNVFYALQRAHQIERVPNKSGSRAAWQKAHEN